MGKGANIKIGAWNAHTSHEMRWKNKDSDVMSIQFNTDEWATITHRVVA